MGGGEDIKGKIMSLTQENFHYSEVVFISYYSHAYALCDNDIFYPPMPLIFTKISSLSTIFFDKPHWEC